MTLCRPGVDEQDAYFLRYIELVPEGSLIDILESQMAEMHEVFGMVDADQAERLHPPYTWTLKQVLGHLIDGERVFGYRMHRIATGDGVAVPGFDENHWVAAMDFSQVSLSALLDEWISLRQGNLALAQRLQPGQWLSRGQSSGKELSARSIAFILAGHIAHHLKIVRQRLQSK